MISDHQRGVFSFQNQFLYFLIWISMEIKFKGLHFYQNIFINFMLKITKSKTLIRKFHIYWNFCFHPRMCIYLWYCYSLSRISLEHPINQILCQFRNILWHFIYSICIHKKYTLNLLAKKSCIVIIEGPLPSKHCIEYYSTWPNIHWGSLIFPFPHNFWSDVPKASTISFEKLTISH